MRSDQKSQTSRGGFRHGDHVRLNRCRPTYKAGPYRLENIEQQRYIFWPLGPLYDVLRHLKLHLVAVTYYAAVLIHLHYARYGSCPSVCQSVSPVHSLLNRK